MRARVALLALFGLALAGCGKDGGETETVVQRDPAAAAAAAEAPATGRTRTVRETRVDVIRRSGEDEGGFDPEQISRSEGQGVVTIASIFGPEKGGQGTGFVLNDRGEIATNAHVVTDGEGKDIKGAQRVYVRFGDRNQVEAKVVGFDPNADVALLRVDPAGLRLVPLPLGRGREVAVGEPVAAIGSPFGEEGSLSIGIVSAKSRLIKSLTGFDIPGAIQTDAAINQGNSGGPLLDAKGRVIGINAQIRTGGGGGDGVGFAINVDTVRRSLDQLRREGRARYGFLGISSVEVYPQLARRFDLGTESGAWVQELVEDGPADKAGLQDAGGDRVTFQDRPYRLDGDVIVRVGDTPIRSSEDVGTALEAYGPGESVTLRVVREGRERDVEVELGERPATAGG